MACSWQPQYIYEMLHAVGAGLRLITGKLQADHNHLTVSSINSIYTLNNPEQHPGSPDW